MQTFEWNGTWWLPSDTKKKGAGILRLSDSGNIILNLSGDFAMMPGDIPLIHGHILFGAITLCQCSLIGAVSSLQYCNQTYSVQTALQGYHFDSLSEIMFSEFELKYSHLEDWFARRAFDVKSVLDDGNNFLTQVVSYNKPKSLQWDIDGVRITLDFDYTHEADSLSEVILRHGCHITVTYVKEVDLNAFNLKTDFLLKSFFTFALGLPVRTLSIKGSSQSITTEELLPNRDYPGGGYFRQAHHPQIEIFRQRESTAVFGNTPSPDSMLFSFEDVENTFDTILMNWFEKHALLRPVYELYFAVVSSTEVFEQHHFLNLAQAVESYHRRVFGGSYDNNWKESTQYRSLIESLSLDISNGFRESLKTKLQYLNEYSLKKRLEEVVRKGGSAAAYFVPNPRTFAADVVHTRNYMTHFSEEL
ncbi:MAG: HEPN domain-containing protein, partial [Bacteroidota bacterium]